MPRPRRICIPGLPHHVVQRGNDRQATFYHDEDYSTYVACLEKATRLFNVSLHSFALMTNHTHLLMTPADEDGLSKIMQHLGRRYVTYINNTYGRTGTLWEGRFKSSVVDSDAYCLTCYRYIELNPVRAGMVSSPADYRWTSFRANGLGDSSRLVVPHPVYLALGRNTDERRRRYRHFVSDAQPAAEIQLVRYATKKGLPLGSDKFRQEIEHHLGRRIGDGRIGRPSKRHRES